MEQQNNGFNLTLPSNSNLDLYPDNNPANFKVKLPQPITLNGKWEVALFEVTYPHNWFDILHGGFVSFMTNPPTPGLQIDTLEECDRQQSKYTQKLMERKLMGLTTEAKKPECWRNTINGEILLWISPGHYGTPANLIQEINDRMAASALRKGYKQPPVQFNYHTPSNEFFTFNKGLLKLEGDKENRDELAKALGLKPSQIKVSMREEGTDSESKEMDVYETPLTGSGCRFYFSPPTILMYSDVVEHNVVGDKMLQLLRTIPITGKHGEPVHKSFKNLIYLPVAKEYLSEIEIQLCADTGELMPFQEGEAIVVLHFKPAIL